MSPSIDAPTKVTEPVELTDLEGVVLAEIAQRGRVTSYAIAKAQAESPSEAWSGSAGAVYPAMKRMTARGLLVAATPVDGGHTRTEYSLSAEGRAALVGWLLDADRAAGLGFDPLRSRVVHLDLVSERERQIFLDNVKVNIEASRSTSWPDASFAQKVHVSVVRARLAWVKTIRGLFD